MEPTHTTMLSQVEDILKFGNQCLKFPLLVYRKESFSFIKQSCGPSQIIYMVACAILGILIVGANLTIIVVIPKNKRLRNAQGIYKLSLACSDILVGAFVIPSVIITWTTDALSTNSYFVALTVGQSSIIMISFFTLLMASFDRLVAVSCPLKYRIAKPKIFAIGSTITFWIISAFLSSLPFFVSSFEFYVLQTGILWMLTGGNIAIGLILVLIALMWSIGIAIFIIVKISSRKASANCSSASRREVRLAKTLGMMLGAFTVSLLPMLQFDRSTLKDLNTLLIMEVTVLFILMSSSLSNCFVYSFRNKIFRGEVKKTMYSIRARVVAITSKTSNSQ